MGIRSLLRNAFGRSKATREETGAAPSGADKPESATIPEAREESVPAATAPAPEAEVPAARTAPTETPDTDPAPAPTTATLPAQGGRADRGDRTAETSAVREDEAAAEAPATAEPSPVDASAVEPSVAEETTVAGKSEADAVEDKAGAATGNDKDVPADEALEATDAVAPAASDTVSDLVSQAFDNPSQAPAADAEPTTDADADEPTTDAAAAEPTADAAEPERAAEPVAEVKETAEEEPVAEAEATPAAEPVATADAVAKPEPEPTVEPADAVVAEAADAAAVEAQAEAEPAAEPEAAPEPVTGAAAKTEAAEAEPKAEPKPKAKSEAKQEETAAAAEKAADRPGAETPGALPTVAPALLSLYKSAGATLDKHGLATQRAAVYLVLDRSGSMRNYYKDGTVQNLAEQALGLAAHFDDDATVPVVFFSTDIDGTADIDLTNYEGRIAELHAGLGHMGRTNYHWAINAVVDHYKKSGSTAPAFVIFQTDGAPTSKPAAEKALCEAAGLPIFWQFIGFGDPDAKGFDFLRKLDDLAVPEKRVIDNAGFFHAGRDPRGLSHDELYQQLMVEFPEWLAEARTAGVIKDN
ncbi:VWA domain-containing protein [Streptomyces caniferus]|uniref:VWA domain-containing protein n=1 Tax=Streptomyces caniferus TaxID=285557 RepID=UPI003721ED60